MSIITHHIKFDTYNVDAVVHAKGLPQHVCALFTEERRKSIIRFSTLT